MFGRAAADGRLYAAVARRSFQRYLTYRTANLAGLLTNAFFGYLRAAVLLAAFESQQGAFIGGYDAQAAVTYAWATQALIMIVAVWGWWDVEATIRTGDVVSDLSKPFSYLGFWLAKDYGRALYYALFRGAPSLLMGQVAVGGLRWPEQPLTWLAVAVSLALAVTVSFGWRMLLNLAAFWTTDARGLGTLALGVSMFLGGFLLPVRFFPEGLQAVLLVLPFAAMFQAPVDVFLERVTGADLARVLGLQAFWALAMLALAQGLTLVATRRVVTQGG